MRENGDQFGIVRLQSQVIRQIRKFDMNYPNVKIVWHVGNQPRQKGHACTIRDLFE